MGPTITSPPFPTAAPVPPVPSLVKAVQTYWGTFAKTGDPNAAGLPTWPKYTEATDQHLDLGAQITVGSGLSNAGCDAWTSSYVVYD